MNNWRKEAEKLDEMFAREATNKFFPNESEKRLIAALHCVQALESKLKAVSVLSEENLK